MQVLLQGGAALYNNTGGDTTLHSAVRSRREQLSASGGECEERADRGAEEQDRQVVVVHVYLAATTGGVLSSSRLPQPNDPCA